MPTYEYACGACGHEWEQAQRITEAPIETCPKCAAAKAHRLISGGTNFILKGGGWYSDLYASPKSDSKKSETGGTSEGKSETKSESKPGEGKSGESKSAESKSETKSESSDSSKGSSSPAPSTAPASST